MKKLKAIILSLAITVCAMTCSAQTSLAVRADSAYNSEDYTLAARLYQQAIDNDGISSELYYNLGNAFFRQGKLGKAIINYERALKIDPSNSDAETNLNFVKTRITDAPEDDSSFLSNLHSSIVSTFSPDAWAWLTFLVFLVLCGTIALYIFSGNIMLRKTGFFGGFVVLIIFVYLLVVSSQTARAPFTHDTAVVIVPTTNLSSTPRTPKNKTEKTVSIHEGTKVEIVDSVLTPDDPVAGKWYDVKINNSTRAWVNAADVEKI
jgi:aerotolerance-related exported protein